MLYMGLLGNYFYFVLFPFNVICKRKMLVKNDSIQHSTTLFPQVLNKMTEVGDKTDDIIEDKLLEIENFDFTINKKKVK